MSSPKPYDLHQPPIPCPWCNYPISTTLGFDRDSVAYAGEPIICANCANVSVFEETLIVLPTADTYAAKPYKRLALHKITDAERLIFEHTRQPGWSKMEALQGKLKARKAEKKDTLLDPRKSWPSGGGAK